MYILYIIHKKLVTATRCFTTRLTYDGEGMFEFEVGQAHGQNGLVDAVPQSLHVKDGLHGSISFVFGGCL